MRRLVLGLDIGITSVGYGIIDIDTGEIVDAGVRLFKEGTAADNVKRRNKRGARRLNARKRNRLNDLRKILNDNGIFQDKKGVSNNPYIFRVKGLTNKLTNHELAIALLHIAKHRGSSLETVDEESKDEASTKAILANNQKELESGKHICQIQFQRLEQEKSLRGIHNNFKTSDYIKEVKQILKNQDLPEEVDKQIIEVIQRKRAYYEGPGSYISPTPYGRFIVSNGEIKEIDLIEKMRGKCSVYPDESRAAKMSYSANLFNLLNDLNNLTVEGEKLTYEQKQDIIEIVNKDGGITPTKLLKYLQVDKENVTGFRIDSHEKPLLTEFKGYKILKKILDKYDKREVYDDKKNIDRIIDILTQCKGIEERKERISELFMNTDITEEIVLEVSLVKKISGYHSLSYKAIEMLNNEMLHSELNQMQLLHQLELFDKNRESTKGNKNIYADDEAILSPVAKRAQRETFKVVNKLREIYGEFETIVVETTRDKNSEDRKKNIRDRQKFYEQQNKQVDELLKTEGYDSTHISGATKLKIRLYLQQNGKSAYTLQELNLKEIITNPRAYEVDHIIPISISLDDSINNKVLVTYKENQEKGQNTPVMAYRGNMFSDKDAIFGKFKAFTLSNHNYSRKKKEYLLYEKDITKFSNIKEFINRNLVDTAYASRVVLNTLMHYFKDNDIDTKVFTVRGSATSAFRKRIHLQKDRDEDYSHHAIDALIVATIRKMGLLNTYLTKYSYEELYDESTGEILKVGKDTDYLDAKYIEYISNLKNYKVAKFSHKIDTKPNRKIADDTIYSTRRINGTDKLVEKIKDIYDPKCKIIAEKILNGKEKEFLMSLYDEQTFALVKDIIMFHYEQFKNDKDKYGENKRGEIVLKGENPLTAYKQEHGFIYKYSKKGNGPAIKSIKFCAENLGNHLSITHNYNPKNKKVILKQVSPYRTDFYVSQEGKYKMVTIRYKDVFYKQSIHKFSIDKEWYEEQKKLKKIDESYEFVCSLHRDELVGITKKEGSKYIYDDSIEGEKKTHDGVHPEVLKFTATNDDTTNKIEVKPIYCYCSKQLMPAIGTFIKLEKYATDIIGNMYVVRDNILKLEF